MKWSERKRHAGRERDVSERSGGVQEAGDHEIIAQVAGPIKMVSEMNPHVRRMARQSLERENDLHMSTGMVVGWRLGVRGLPAVVEVEAEIGRHVHTQAYAGAADRP